MKDIIQRCGLELKFNLAGLSRVQFDAYKAILIDHNYGYQKVSLLTALKTDNNLKGVDQEA